MSEFQITSEKVDGAMVLHLSGDPQLAGTDAVEETVTRTLASKPMKVVIDLGKLEFIASMLAGRLVALQSSLKRQGGRALIANPRPAIKDALERMRVVSVIPIMSTVEEALANESEPARVEAPHSRSPWSSES